jgi:Ca-activated chloride channel homolog
MTKKWISSFIVMAIIFLNCGFLSIYAAGPLNSSSRIEGMLVVDVSNSMKTSDPNKLSNEAMKMFVDMSSFNGDKIGVIAYADEVIREKALVKIRSGKDKLDLKDFIDSLGRFPYTDLSVGVKEALNVLDSGHESDYSPLIVLLADGNNDLNKSKLKTLKQADDDIKAAVANAKAKGYPIYTIGLNANGKLNKDVLTNIAKATHGKFFEATSADKLPGILSEIFANHLKLKMVPVNQLTASGDFQDININVPNENVLEANISLISSNPIEMKLVDPKGNEQSIPSDQILLSTSKSYSMLKLIKPIEGNWTLKVKGVPQDKIDINLVFNYDLQLKLSPLAGQSYKAGDSVKIAAFFEDNNQRITDKNLYNPMRATLFVKDLDKGNTAEYPLIAGDQGFQGQFTLGDSANYEVMVKAEDTSFYRETQPEKITMQKAAAAPVATKAPSPAKEEKSFPWTYIGLAVIGVLLLATLLFRKIKKVKRGFSGQMVVEIKDEVTGERSNPQYKKLKGFKGKFHLHQLLGLAPEFLVTDRIIFKSMQGDTLLLTNQSNCTIEKGGRPLDAKKGREVKKNDRLRIVLKQVNKSIYIEYIS